ncbi:MAG: hypothetical protein L6R45_31800 [Anaerolineae bacterium]|nr:hypothetical protein [Anaerolineae bacterium]
MKQFYRLNHLKEKIKLTPEDLLIIKGYQNRTLITKLRPHAPRIRELLEMMWANEEG